MKIVPISDLEDKPYFVHVLNTLKQSVSELGYFNCIGNPKKKNLFLYLDGCDAVYTLKNGTTLSAKSGNIVYTPVNGEYSVRFVNVQSDRANTVGINFFLFQEEGVPFTFSDSTYVFPTKDKRFKLLFAKINENGERGVPSFTGMKADFYSILAELYEYAQGVSFENFEIIAKGIRILKDGNPTDKSMREIADICGVSECYFRKKFKEFAGVTPGKYLIFHKINKAKAHLKYDNLSVADIAEHLGFADAAYFIKKFKEQTGMTPGDYRKNF